jgi:2-oxoglutarate/2-oxoacid ferredoxin oxidoreductase subunit beta
VTAIDLGVPTIGGLDGVPTFDGPQKAKDYKSDQEVRWCPGCGDYAVLAAVQSFLPSLGLKRENIVFVSGIGCSSRFPYYMNTYGVHSIHGRAPALATGLAVSRPDLSVWVVTGDGDALSIGGNHLMHTLRRNVNLKILLFNNRIYGLTKGQYSPTSETGKITKSTPMGSLDHPFNPVSLALGAEATFVARALDSDRKQLTEVLAAAAQHRGTALVEIYQNCPIFNDGAFDALKEAGERERHLIPLRDGEPIRFGPADETGAGELGVVRDPATGTLAVRKVAEVGTDALVVHDATREDPSQAFALSRLTGSDLAHVVTGVFRSVQRTTYDDDARAQVAQAKESRPADLQGLLRGKDTWTVAG